MYWYQKSPGDRALKRIGQVYYSNIELEESFKEHFNISGDMSGNTAKNGSLFIVNLKAPDHIAVYYCAASYAHWLQIPSPLYKNSEPTFINIFGLQFEAKQAPPSQLLFVWWHCICHRRCCLTFTSLSLNPQSAQERHQLDLNRSQSVMLMWSQLLIPIKA